MLPIAILIPQDYWTRTFFAPPKGGNPSGNNPGHRSLPDILAALKAAGAEGRLVTPEMNARLENYAGLVLPGGADIDPRFYGQEVISAADLDPEYDAFQLEWTRQAFRADLPLLGICRGMQVMNVAAGGSLLQDVAGHMPAVPRAQAVHPVEIAPDSALRRVLGAERVAVNSIHHQAVARLGEGLRPVAWAPDGVVEALERSAVQRGVQFHPEDMRAERPFQRLFDQLVADC